MQTICIHADGLWQKTYYDDNKGLSQWHVTKILQDKSGYMWFSTWNGLNRFDGYEFAVFKTHPGDGCGINTDRIRNIVYGNDGSLYCYIDSQVWRFSLHTYKFECPDYATRQRYARILTNDPEVFKEHDVTFIQHSFDNVRQIFTDFQGNKWFLGRYGVQKLTREKEQYLMLEAIPKDIVRCMYIDKKNRIWVTTRNLGIVAVLDSKAQLIGYLGRDGKLHRQQQRFAPIYTVMQQHNGTVWLGSKPGGLYMLKETSDGTFSIRNFTKGSTTDIRKGETINCDNIYDIKEDNKGRLWVATQGGGINIIENKGVRIVVHNKDNDLKNYPLRAVNVRRLKIVADSIALATTTDGFLVMKDISPSILNAKFNIHLREAGRSNSLSCNATMDMLIDRKGRLFISTESGGVNMLQTKDLSASKFSFRHFNTSNGMGSDVTLAMCEADNRLLVQCCNQLTIIDADKGKAENYNQYFFSIPPRFSDAEPVMIEGNRWLLSLETGVMVVPHQELGRHTFCPRIVVTSYVIPGMNPLYPSDNNDTIRLSANQRNITIRYAALDFSDNSQIKYATRLQEMNNWDFVPLAKDYKMDNENWSSFDISRSVSLYDLSPGKYRLDIRSTNAEGIVMNNVRSLYIIVEPTIWETPLAKISYIIFTITLIFVITYVIFYIRLLRKQRKENLEAYLRLIGDKDHADITTHNIKRETKISEEDNIFMDRLITFVTENLGNSDISVDDMAAATATSRSSLNRKTKSLLGLTPADFLKEARIKQACQQLTSTVKSINDIAYSCGFSDPKYFSKCFRTSKGMSPTEYRNSGK